MLYYYAIPIGIIILVDKSLTWNHQPDRGLWMRLLNTAHVTRGDINLISLTS